MRPKHTESIWGRAMPIEVEGAPALALAPEDQVLMLSVHLHRHGFNRLLWFQDIDRLARVYEEGLNWGMVVADARSEGAASSLWYVFRFLEKMLATPFPKEMIASLKPSPIVRGVFSRIWPDSQVLDLRGVTRRRAVQFSVLESWRGMIPSLLLMGRRREKAKILIRRITPF